MSRLFERALVLFERFVTAHERQAAALERMAGQSGDADRKLDEEPRPVRPTLSAKGARDVEAAFRRKGAA